MSLRTRLLLAFAYVLVLVIVALEIPLILNVSRRVDAEVKAQAAAEAQLVAASASGQLGSPGELARIASEAADDLNGRVIVVNRQGRLVADSAGVRASSYLDRPEIQTALVDGRIAQGRRFSETLGESLLYTAVPIVENERRVGAVRVTQSVEAIDDRVRRDVLGLIGIGLIALVLGLVFAWILAGTLARPLQRLAASRTPRRGRRSGGPCDPGGLEGAPGGRPRLQRHDRARRRRCSRRSASSSPTRPTSCGRRSPG